MQLPKKKTIPKKSKLKVFELKLGYFDLQNPNPMSNTIGRHRKTLIVIQNRIPGYRVRNNNL